MSQWQQVSFENHSDGRRRTGWVSRDKAVKLGQFVKFVGEDGAWWNVAAVYPFQLERDNIHQVYALKGYWAR
jgi:hypothetical protein